MSKYIGAGNNKIITRDQGGGNKKSGGNTSVGNPKSTTNIYRSQTGPINYTLACVNQLGGIGRGRSQFRNNADGKRCIQEDNLEIFRRYLFDIQYYIQYTALYNIKGIQGPSNEFIKYELCLVGNSETLINDICINHPSSYITISNDDFGSNSENVVFTHFLSSPPEFSPYNQHLVSNPKKITYWNVTSSIWTYDYLNVDPIQYKINFCNNYLKTLEPKLFNSYTISNFGIHTLGLINNNIELSGNNSASFLQNFDYGKLTLFNNNSPILNNNINIYNNIYNVTYIPDSGNKITLKINDFAPTLLSTMLILPTYGWPDNIEWYPYPLDNVPTTDSELLELAQIQPHLSMFEIIITQTKKNPDLLKNIKNNFKIPINSTTIDLTNYKSIKLLISSNINNIPIGTYINNIKYIKVGLVEDIWVPPYINPDYAHMNPRLKYTNLTDILIIIYAEINYFSNPNMRPLELPSINNNTRITFELISENAYDNHYIVPLDNISTINNINDFKNYLKDILFYCNTTLLYNTLLQTNSRINDGLNDFNKYILCLVENNDSVINDICTNNISAYNTISNENFGIYSDNVIFTNLSNNSKITYWNYNNSSWSTKSITINYELILSRITICNNYIKNNNINGSSNCSLALINNNIILNGKNSTSFLQDYGYGKSTLFITDYNSIIVENNDININIFNNSYYASFSTIDESYFLQYLKNIEVNAPDTVNKFLKFNLVSNQSVASYNESGSVNILWADVENFLNLIKYNDTTSYIMLENTPNIELKIIQSDISNIYVKNIKEINVQIADIDTDNAITTPDVFLYLYVHNNNDFIQDNSLFNKTLNHPITFKFQPSTQSNI